MHPAGGADLQAGGFKLLNALLEIAQLVEAGLNSRAAVFADEFLHVGHRVLARLLTTFSLSQSRGHMRVALVA